MSQKGSDDNRYKTWNHHLSENAQDGNCVHCHHSVRTTPVGSSWCTVAGSRVPKQPPCAYCHVDAAERDATGSWQLQFFDFATDGFNTPLTKLTSTTHTIPSVSGSPIDIHDFAVCFECHDAVDMFDGLKDGNNVDIKGANTLPNKVYPYHASGMTLDLSGAANQETDPGTYTWFPINRASGYDGTDEAANDGGSDPVMDDLAGSWGPGQSDDLFFAYHYHPGRGGIVGTSNTISSSSPNYGGDVTTQVGSFNILFPFMTINTSNTPKYYQAGDAESGAAPKNVYQNASKAYDGDYSSENFGVGGSVPTATCNSSYTDQYGKNWNFCGVHNVPYTDYTVNPNPASDVYWATVPVFNDIAAPTVADSVRLLTVDCGGQTVTARSHLTGDYNLNPTPATGDLQITSPETVDMTYDAPTDTWTGSLTSACTSSQTVTVTSNISGGGSASFTVP
jgi:hypothetical protein